MPIFRMYRSDALAFVLGPSGPSDPRNPFLDGPQLGSVLDGSLLGRRGRHVDSRYAREPYGLDEISSLDLPVSSKAESIEAFSVLLRDCLRVKAHEDLLILFDESLLDWVDALTEAAIRHHLRPLFAYLPKRYQLALMDWKQPGGDDSSVPLPRPLRDAFANTRSVVNLLDGDLATSSLRGAILNIPRVRGCRLAHIPGLTREILDVLVDSPIQKIERRAELMAWALGEAWEAELITHSRDPTGRNSSSHQLRFQLEGWHNAPLTSPGVIYPDSWGNIPPGETFCCPENLTSIQGEVLIDGSVPGAVLGPKDSAVLCFEEGRMVEIRAPKSSRARTFLEQERRRAEARGDESWNLFAELGIGLNPAIQSLTGNSLFDEKAAGTIHIAIGDNSIFDGPIISETHADMVATAPDLKLDGRDIIQRGEIDIEAIRTWRREIEMKPLKLQTHERLELDDARMDEREGRLVLRLSRNGRIGYVHLADEAVGRRLAELTRCLPHNQSLSKRAVDSRTRGWPKYELEHLLGVLRHFQIAHVQIAHVQSHP